MLLPAPPIAAELPSKWRWDDVPRVVVVGDVHGSYAKLVSLLKGTVLVDDGLAWSGGRYHLVFVGDLVDRGPDDRQVLDLARRLQVEAEAAGGRVHTLLGNHEVMNLSGDLRYVSKKGFLDFADQESRRDRNQALLRFRSTTAPGALLTQIRPAFDERFPPGYFGRLRTFSLDGEYGPWLLEQPAIVMVNGVVFLHGGLTEEVAALGLDVINQRVRESVLGFMENGQRLVQLAGAPPSYLDAMQAASEAGSRRRDRSDRATAARAVLEYSRSLPYVPAGPLWYRGVSVENERVERGSVERSLAALGARAMVVAHTPTQSGRINSRFNGRVYRVDVGMAYGRQPLALVFEGGKARVFDPATSSYAPPMVEAPQGEGWSRFGEQLPEAQMLQFLREAEVTGCTPLRSGVRFAEVCELEVSGLHLRAVFQTVDERPGEVAEEPFSVPRTYRNEIAAYLLDRMLEIGLVPATVERTIDDRTGSLQIWPEAAVDLLLLETYDQLDLLQGLEEKLSVAGAFSAAMDVHGRHGAGTMLLPQERRIALADSTKAFSTSKRLDPALLPSPCPPIPADRELFFRSISPDDLEEQLGGYLSGAQIEALLARRDQILDACPSESLAR